MENVYLEEDLNNNKIKWKIEDVLLSHKTQYQDLLIIKNKIFGKSFFINGDLQSTEYDERIYHELLVHPIMNTTDIKDKRVLIIGGGSCTTLREVSKYGKDLKEIVMVDLDREVIEITGNYLPTYNEIHSNNYDILYIDIIQYFKHNTNKFDIVIIDLVDISDNTLHLYDETFLTLLEKNTTKNSIIVTQASSLLSFENHNKIVKEIYKKYPYIKRFGSYIPSFYDYWGFAIYSKNNFNISSISENKLEMLNNKDILNSFDIPNYIDKNLICTE